MISLKVEVPVACFRESRSREYRATYPVPPPATVYGMLLSLIGETDRYLHCGVRLAIALIAMPEKSTVVRKVHRFKRARVDPTNIRPDYQEVLTDIEFFVWVDSQFETSNANLSVCIRKAFVNPSSISRFGGLSLGESRDLVNSIDLVDIERMAEYPQNSLSWLIKQKDGRLTLPYWVNHLGQKGTLWHHYSLQQLEQKNPPNDSWTEIMPQAVAY